MTGAAPDRRQDERACPHCDGSGIRQFDSDGYEACRCLLPAVSPVPGQQRAAVARWLRRFHCCEPDSAWRDLSENSRDYWRGHADELLALLAATRDGGQA